MKNIKNLAILLIKGYQISIGQVLPRVCRFEPTCSNYAIEAIARHGIVQGTMLALYRILRCNPFCDFGYDPVPTKKGKNE